MRLNRIVAESVQQAPVSSRELARRAGVNHAFLARVVTGERNASPALAKALAAALDAIGSEAARSAARLRRAIAKGGTR